MRMMMREWQRNRFRKYRRWNYWRTDKIWNIDEKKMITMMKKEKVFVDGIDVVVINERVQYIGLDGKLITENLVDYSKNILKSIKLWIFLNEWSKQLKKLLLN